ncbi:MAG TPA: carbohydrate-binding domain-containing protein [Polyangiaceae bacterium]|nr:carbohydrate-binding domain-containing protein [Polyangiaceae bacterium]
MKNRTKLHVSLFALLLAGTGCQGSPEDAVDGEDSSASDAGDGGDASDSGGGEGGADTSDEEDSADTEGSISVLPGSILDTPETAVMFTARDLEQVADTSDATYIELVSGQDVTISAAGVYVISGSATNVTIVVDAGQEAKVQLVLSGVSVTNDDAPVVYVKTADKVYLTTTDGENHLEVTGAFVPDGETNLDAVIFSKEDLVLNGTGSLEIVSAQGNGVTSKDDLKITGGTLVVTSALDGLEANDSIRIAGGDVTIDSGKDGLHAENEDDDSLGYVYVSGGTIRIAAADDGIHGTSVVQIDGGTIDITESSEGIEATYIQINDGDVSVLASDDGINVGSKSSAYDVVIEVNGGTIYVEVAGNDVDGFDANGDIVINGGTISVVAPAQPPSGAFDFDGTGQLNGGTVTVNGEVITELVADGGGGPGGP